MSDMATRYCTVPGCAQSSVSHLWDPETCPDPCPDGVVSDVASSPEKDAPRRAWPIGGIAGEVAQFNDLVPVGSPVLYWPGIRAGEGIASTTRSRAWLLGDHTPVVMVEGYSGGIALTHVCPIPPGVDQGAR